MNAEKLYEGQVFKNYKEMCDVLGLEVKESTNSKNSQFKTLSQYCNYEKQGHKVLILELHETKQKRKDNRGGDFSSLTTPLTITNPRLASQWDAERNGALADNVTKTTKEYYWWHCDECGENVYLSPKKRFHKSKSNADENITCPCCWMSKGAKRIYKLLMKNNIDFRLEYTFDDLYGLQGSKLRFDFAVIDKNENLISLIEYDGGFHDINETTQAHDGLKNDYCKNRFIPLLRIHHSEDKLIEMKVSSFLGLIPSKEIELINNLIDENAEKINQVKEMEKLIQQLQSKIMENDSIINRILHKEGNK